jgi:hypothetical protein
MCSQTCSFCVEFKIRIYKPHDVEDCPIRESAYCSHCACYGLHFTKDCVNVPRRRRRDEPVQSGAPAEEPSNALVINNNMDLVYSYLKLWGKDERSKNLSEKSAKKLLVEEAKKHGYSSVVYN